MARVLTFIAAACTFAFATVLILVFHILWIRLFVLSILLVAAGFASDQFSMRRYEKERKKAHARYGAEVETVAFTCPKCMRSYVAPETLAGKRFTCRSCQNVFNVNALPSVVAIDDTSNAKPLG